MVGVITNLVPHVDAEFATIGERGFQTLVANIARVNALLEGSQDPTMQQALLLAQRAWSQLDRQNPSATVRDEQVGDSRSQANVSRMLAGRPRQHPSKKTIMPKQVKLLPGGRGHH